MKLKTHVDNLKKKDSKARREWEEDEKEPQFAPNVPAEQIEKQIGS